MERLETYWDNKPVRFNDRGLIRGFVNRYASRLVHGPKRKKAA